MNTEVCVKCEEHDKCTHNVYGTGMFHYYACNRACVWPPICTYCWKPENVKILLEITSRNFHDYAICKECFCKEHPDEADDWHNLTPPQFNDQGHIVYKSARRKVLDCINEGKLDLSKRFTEKVFRGVAEELNVSYWDVHIIAKEQRRQRGIKVNKPRS
jgi:hypothetical protein